jgi:hypothetical protein
MTTIAAGSLASAVWPTFAVQPPMDLQTVTGDGGVRLHFLGNLLARHLSTNRNPLTNGPEPERLRSARCSSKRRWQIGAYRTLLQR